MNQFCEITPELRRLAAKSAECSKIDPELYTRYDVKRGLRDLNGKGVLVGLTEISEVSSTKIVNGESVPADGELFYRGYNVKDLIAGLPEDSHFGFEECTYLLLFGKLSNFKMVYVKGDESLVGTVVPVKVDGLRFNSLQGHITD